jgi:hypothetical protein
MTQTQRVGYWYLHGPLSVKKNFGDNNESTVTARSYGE